MLRAERDVSQTEVAFEAQVSEKRYWRIENGFTEATDVERARLAAYFGKKSEWIFATPRRPKTAQAA